MKVLVKGNNLYGDQDALNYIKTLQDTTVSLPSYLHAATHFLAIHGVSIQYNSIPYDIDAHVTDGKTIVGWKGTISGTTKNTSSSSTLYGPGFKTWSSHGNSFTEDGVDYFPLYLGEAESCTGGGADNFSYHNEFIIHMNTFPKILDEYANLRTDKFKKDLQLQFDKVIGKLSNKFKNDYNKYNHSFMDDNRAQVLDCNKQILQAEKVKTKCRQIIADLQDRADNHATKEASFQLPEPPSALIDLYEYAELSKKMLKTKKQLSAAQIAQLTTDIQQIVEDNIQLLI